MVYHTPTKAKARSVPVSFYSCWSILGVLCGQCGYDPLAWLCVQWCNNATHAPTDELRGVSMYALMVGAHGTPHTIPGKIKKCASFSSIHVGPPFEYCVASMDMIPLLWLLV